MRATRLPLAGSLCVALLLLGACAERRTPAAKAAPPPPLTAPYAAAARAGARVYRLDAAISTVYVLVGKAGPLAGFGHRHVFTVHHLRGFARLAANGAGEAELRFPVTALVLNPAAAQKIFKNYKAPDQADMAGTRAHMFEVLDPRRYPWVRIRVRGRIGTHAPAQASISLHGERHAYKIMGTFLRHDRHFTARGTFSIRQTDFGMKPYSILLGALRVKNTLTIRYHLRFDAWRPSSPTAPR